MSAPFRIESPNNPRFKSWEGLLESRGIRKQGEFLLAGRKTVPEALERHAGRFTAVLVTSEREVAGWNLPEDMTVYELTPRLFAELDPAGTRFPILLGTVPDMPAADRAAPPQGLELVLALGDPANLGAVLRSAAAFGAARVILLQESVHPFHPKCLRAAANAQFELDLHTGPSFRELANAAGPIVALDAGGESLSTYKWPRDVRLVLGEEGQGVPADLSATRLSVPTTGKVESLNATVAASVAMYGYYAGHGGQA